MNANDMPRRTKDNGQHDEGSREQDEDRQGQWLWMWMCGLSKNVNSIQSSESRVNCRRYEIASAFCIQFTDAQTK